MIDSSAKREPAPHKRAAAVILLIVLMVNAAALWPELSVARVDLNDNVSHFTLIEGMVQAIERGQNPLDFWSPEAALGYPEIRTYQLLAHALVVFIYFALGKAVSLMTVFVWVRYLSLVLLPLSFYAAVLLLELPPLTAAAAALLAPLISTSGLFGVEYYSFVWRGLGLFPQAVATHFLLLSIGMAFRALRRGTSIVLSGFLLGITAACHLIYGYMGALTVCLLALLPDRDVPRSTRILRTVVIGAVTAILCVYQLVPLYLDRAIINHSIVEPAWKWDSFGAAQVLQWLFTGGLLDYGRLPVLTLLTFAGVAVILWRFRDTRRLPPADSFVLAGAVFWILVFFGRPFWGPLLILLGVSPDMHVHRVSGGVHIFLIFLAALGLAFLWQEAAGRWHAAVAVIGTGVLLAAPVLTTAQYLAGDAEGGTQNLAQYVSQANVIGAVVADLKGHGGRTYAGLSTGWGAKFEVGAVPIYAVLSVHQVPTVSILYHTMALPGDIMAHFDERKPMQYRLFDIRSVLVPEVLRPSLPAFLMPRSQIGRFVILDAPGGGYFDVVDAPAAVTVNRGSFYQLNKLWLESNWLENKAHLYLDFFHDAPAGLPHSSAESSLPQISFPVGGPGQVRSQSEDAGVYRAEVEATRAGFALFKMTWHPEWKASVDGKLVKTAMLSPGFIGIPVMQGRHAIECRYEPGNWKIWLALAGTFVVLLLLAAERFGKLPRIGAALLPADIAPPAEEPVETAATKLQPRKRRPKAAR
ncbi:MAG: hypothetical protein C5B51_00925 [Terriglobia bacterium]|nr:MAG: hypothetical protein C5B51_00925 [Terriglobia bacterium]